MSTTFKVFVDADVSSAPATNNIKTRSTTTTKKPIKSVSKTSSTTLKSKSKSIVAVHDENDKENVDPLTGLAPSSSTATKKTKKTSGTGLKPKTTTSKKVLASPGLRVADGNAKHSPASGAVKKGVAPKRKPLGGMSNLAVMLEEAENEVENTQTETAADRRARELTVLPLADISEAFAPASKKSTESQPSASTSSTLAPKTPPASPKALVSLSPPSTPKRGTKRNCEDEEVYSSGPDSPGSPSKRQRTKAPLPRNAACNITPLALFASMSPSAGLTVPPTPSSPSLRLTMAEL